MIFSLFSDPLFHQYLFDQAYRFGLYIPYIVKDILTFIQTHYFIIVHLIKSIILVCKFSISSTTFSLLFRIFISSLFIWSRVSNLVMIEEISFHKSRCSVWVVVSRSLIFSTFPDKLVVIDTISSFRSSFSFWAMLIKSLILSLTLPDKLVAWDTISCVRNRCSVWAIVIDHWFFHRLSQTNWSLETPFPVLGVAEWSELWHLDHRFFHRLSQTNCL